MSDIYYHAEKRLDTLKKRTKRCVCKYCGEKLKLRRIVFSQETDARVEIFCTGCDRIEYGVEPQIYESAKYFVENSGFSAYPDLENNDRTTQMTIAKVCEIMAWHDQNLGFMNENGYVVPVNMNENYTGRYTTFSEDELSTDI